MTQEEKRRIGEMRAAGCSYIRIAAALNISVNSIKSYCRRHSLGAGMALQKAQPVRETHALPELAGPVLQEATSCEQCGNPVQQIAGRKRRRFCSEPCRLAWWAAHRSQMNIWTFDGKGELMLTIMSSLAQEESRSISENCAWGQRKRFADGKVSVPFGRFLGYDRGPDGNLVVNEEQAKVVRRIYAEFLRGYTPYAIANHLTVDGIPTPGGKTVWGKGVVLSILTNEKYKGGRAAAEGVHGGLHLQEEGQKHRAGAAVLCGGQPRGYRQRGDLRSGAGADRSLICLFLTDVSSTAIICCA